MYFTKYKKKNNLYFHLFLIMHKNILSIHSIDHIDMKRCESLYKLCMCENTCLTKSTLTPKHITTQPVVVPKEETHSIVSAEKYPVDWFTADYKDMHENMFSIDIEL